MKIRNGFVSNSSSSSFIVASKKRPTITVELPVDFEISTTAGLIKWFGEEYGLEDEAAILSDEYQAKKYLSGVAAIEKGLTLYLGNASSEDYDGIGTYLYGLSTMENLGDYAIIQDLNY